jgi:GNAT superfamily N-acetyltransferase
MAGFADIVIRPMTHHDVSTGMELVRAAGWNQTEADWNRFLHADSSGCFVAEAEREVCGTVATIVYEDRIAWIGMVLVRRAVRGRGIGTELVKSALEHLDSRGPLTIKLDATPQGRPVYERFGFKPELEIERWSLRGRFPPPVQESSAQATVPVPQTMDSVEEQESAIEDAIALDAEIFGASRSALLRSLDHDAPEFTAVVSTSGKPAGYTLGRHGLFADHLGPWAAHNREIARFLLTRFLERSRGRSVIVDCVKSHPVAAELLRSGGFELSRPLTRMVRGSDLRNQQSEMFCAILGPEFG